MIDPNWRLLEPETLDEAELHSLNAALEVYESAITIDERIRDLKGAMRPGDPAAQAQLFCLGVCRGVAHAKMGHA